MPASTSPALRRASSIELKIVEESAKVAGFLPLPNAVDALCHGLSDVYARAPAKERAAIRAGGTVEGRRILLMFAERMAILSVREKDRGRIFPALIALVIEDGRLDARETTMRLTLLLHSAQKLGGAPAAMFDRAARLASPEMAATLREAAEHPPSLESSGFREVERADGFFYERRR